MIAEPQRRRLLCVVLLSIGSIYVFHRALDLYFAQEDFRGLAAAVGVYPRHTHLWRYLSVQAFMDLFYPLFRDRPGPYHAVSLALHCINAGLLFALLCQRLRAASALVGASFFAVHPALFTALYWHSARADILAAFFALVTTILALRSGRERWLAVPAFAASILSKESALPLPAVIAVLRWRNSGTRPTSPDRYWGVDGLLIALSFMSALYLFYLSRAHGSGIQIGLDSQAAYAFDFGPSLFRNLLTYVGWTVDLPMLRPGLRFVDQQNPPLFPLAIGVLIAAGLLALWPTLRRRGWLGALLGFFLLLVPVLALKNHSYHYYLYAPLLAAALSVAALVDALMDLASALGHSKRRKAARTRRPEPVRAPALAGPIIAALCWLGLTWNGARLVAQMERRPSPVYPGLRGDPIVDRALIAGRAIRSLRSAKIPPGTELVLIMRERIALIARIVRGSGEQPPPPQEVYPESNVKTSLFDGIGVRALVPAVDSVSFALDLGTSAPGRWYGVYAPTGEVEVHSATSIDSLLRTSWVTRW